MTRQEVIVKLQDLGFVVKLNILGKTVTTLVDNDGQYSVYYWGNFDEFKERIEFKGNDLRCSEVYQAFSKLNLTLKNVIKDKRFKASKVGTYSKIISGISSLYFVPKALDTALIQLDTEAGKKIRSDLLNGVQQSDMDKVLANHALIGVGGLLLLIAITGTFYYLDKEYFHAIDVLIQNNIIRYSEVMNIGTLIVKKNKNFSLLYNFKENGTKKNFIEQCVKKWKQFHNNAEAHINGLTYKVEGSNENEVRSNASKWFDENVGNNNGGNNKFSLSFVADGLVNALNISKWSKGKKFVVFTSVILVLFLVSCLFKSNKKDNIWSHRVDGLLELITKRIFGNLLKGGGK